MDTILAHLPAYILSQGGWRAPDAEKRGDACGVRDPDGQSHHPHKAIGRTDTCSADTERVS
jgi:hypothetical protein